ncbi:ROK family protein [Streptococcus danieliae]|nr:ROK family protein [Streptococcus danieliae]
MNLLGIDIGGTTIKADVYDEQGISQGYTREFATGVDMTRGKNWIAEQLRGLVRDMQAELSLDGLAISTAGVVDSRGKKVVYAGPTIPAYAGLDFQKEIGDPFGLPVSVENDVNCALLGESWKGLDEAYQDVAMITVGTGIGGAILQAGKLVNGHAFTAGEVGYLPIGSQEWQSLASTTGLLQSYQLETGIVLADGRAFFERLDQGEEQAQQVFERFISNLAQGLLIMSYLLNPQVLLIGGGILARADKILPALRQRIAELVVDSRFLPEQILAASVGNEAGRLGAVKHFLRTQASESSFKK